MTIEYGLLSTHPPTRCGLATFNSALAAQLTIAGVSGGVVRVAAAGDDQRPARGIVHTWPTSTAGGWRDAADALNCSDVVVLPYDSREQVTSGVLIEAVAAGVPVVATAFPHAVELLADGRGHIVAHRDPTALARAIQRALSEPGPATPATRNVGSDRAAHAPTLPTLRWPAVAERYETLARRLVASGSTTAKAQSA